MHRECSYGDRCMFVLALAVVVVEAASTAVVPEAILVVVTKDGTQKVKRDGSGSKKGR